MDGINSRPTQTESKMVEAPDWRTQLQRDYRPRVVNKIMDILKRHLRIWGSEELAGLRKHAVRFEEKVHNVATSHVDYLREISLEMLRVEMQSQRTRLTDSVALNPQNPINPACQSMQSEVHDEVHPAISLLSHPKARQQLLPENVTAPGLPPLSMPFGQSSDLQETHELSLNPWSRASLQSSLSTSQQTMLSPTQEEAWSNLQQPSMQHSTSMAQHEPQSQQTLNQHQMLLGQQLNIPQQRQNRSPQKPQLGLQHPPKALQWDVTRRRLYSSKEASSTGRTDYKCQQQEAGNHSPVSTQLLLSAPTQVYQHSSPQIDPQRLSKFLSKPGDPNNQEPCVSRLSNAHATTGSPQDQSVAISISVPPEFTIADGSQRMEQPLERLMKVVKSMPPKDFSAAVNDIWSVISIIDRIAGSVPGNGSKAATGADLPAMTKYLIQASSSAPGDTCFNTISPVGSVNASLKQVNSVEMPDFKSTASSRTKRRRVEV